MAPLTALIGGTGLSSPEHFKRIETLAIDTPFGPPSAPLLRGEFHGHDILFLARHGNPHVLPPHKVNYRANLWAIHSLGVKYVLAVAAVGGITPKMSPAVIAIPDQIIDYSYGRATTFFEDNLESVTHIDFTEPYSPRLRQSLIQAAQRANLSFVEEGVYGCTQGPRLETPAEILRMERDGCDLVGMTGMPEACLARELGLEYASISVVANWAAGKQQGEITMSEIMANLGLGMKRVATLIDHWKIPEGAG